MNVMMRWTIVSVMLSMMIFAATPARSAVATQMWKCEMGANTTEEEVEEAAAKWLKAARQMDGGDQLEASVLFPVAVNVVGNTDFMFIVVAPSFAEWGKFWDEYQVSDAADADQANADVDCPDSALWQSIKVEVE
jgi:hypothetical protein